MPQGKIDQLGRLILTKEEIKELNFDYETKLYATIVRGCLKISARKKPFAYSAGITASGVHINNYLLYALQIMTLENRVKEDNKFFYTVNYQIDAEHRSIIILLT